MAVFRCFQCGCVWVFVFSNDGDSKERVKLRKYEVKKIDFWRERNDI